MNERDCVAADTGLGPSIKKLLASSDDYYYEGESDPKIDETKVNYPPALRESYSDEVKEKIKKIKKSHKKFGKKNIESAWAPLVNKNSGILSKHKAFRTDDGIFLSNLIQVAMEMQNIEDSLTDDEKEEDEKEFMLNLFNGGIEFDDPIKEEDEDEDSDDSDNEDDEENQTNIERLLRMFENIKRELVNEYELEKQSQSQKSDQSVQTQPGEEENQRNIIRIKLNKQ
jgi:hypothetical protein